MFEILHLLVGYFGLGFLATGLCAAGAFFVTAFVPPPFGDTLRRWLIDGAIISAVATTIYTKGYLDEKARWTEAIAAQVARDDAARAAAEHDVARGVPDNYDRNKH